MQTTLTKQDVIARIHGALPELRRKYPIGYLGLFGSYVRDEAGPDSDVDVLVEFNGKVNLFEYLQMEIDLAEVTGLRTDLVIKSGLKKYIAPYVLAEVERIA